MLKELETSGKNIDDAIEAGLKELNCSKEDVEIKILDEGTKGLFGLMGAKPAKVLLTLKDKNRKSEEAYTTEQTTSEYEENDDIKSYNEDSADNYESVSSESYESLDNYDDIIINTIEAKDRLEFLLNILISQIHQGTEVVIVDDGGNARWLDKYEHIEIIHLDL